jgi:hypothetical protein
VAAITAAPAASAMASASAGAAWAQPPLLRSNLVHCKALGRRGRIAIGVLREELVALVPEEDQVYAFTYHRDLARVTLSRIRRDGAPLEVIGRHTALGEPKGFALTTAAAYFTRNRTLYRLSRHDGNTEELAKGFSSGIAVYGNDVYGVSCDAKKPPDHLVRIATTGGSVEPLAVIERAKGPDQDGSGAPCDYRSLAADGSAVYVASWGSRSVLAVSLAERAVRELAKRKPFPSNLHLEGEDVLFQAAGGIFRTAKSDAHTERVTDLGSAPFALVAYSDQGLYIHEGKAYVEEEWTYALPWSTGKAERIEYYRLLKPDDVTGPGVGIRGIAVDDECIYTARQVESHIELYARSRR